MADENLETRLLITARDEASDVLRGLTERIGETAGSLSRLLIGGTIEEFARRSFTAYAETERAMERIQFASRATDEQMKKFGSTVEEMARKSGMAIDDVARSVERFRELSGLDSLGEATEQFEKLITVSRVTGVNVDDLGRAAAAAIHNLNVMPGEIGDIVKQWASDVPPAIAESFAQTLPRLTATMDAVGFRGEKNAKQIGVVYTEAARSLGSPRLAAQGLMELMERANTSSTQFGRYFMPMMARAQQNGTGFIGFLTEADAFFDKWGAYSGDRYKVDQFKRITGADDHLIRSMEQLHPHIARMTQQIADADKNLGRFNDTARKTGVDGKAALNELSGSMEELKEAVGAILLSWGVPDGLRQLSAILTEVANQSKRINENIPKPTTETTQTAGHVSPLLTGAGGGAITRFLTARFARLAMGPGGQGVLRGALRGGGGFLPGLIGGAVGGRITEGLEEQERRASTEPTFAPRDMFAPGMGGGGPYGGAPFRPFEWGRDWLPGGAMNLNMTAPIWGYDWARSTKGITGIRGENMPGAIPGKAEGGPVGLSGPEVIQVGERGPEYVVPNSALGGTGQNGETTKDNTTATEENTKAINSLVNRIGERRMAFTPGIGETAWAKEAGQLPPYYGGGGTSGGGGASGSYGGGDGAWGGPPPARGGPPSVTPSEPAPTDAATTAATAEAAAAMTEAGVTDVSGQIGHLASQGVMTSAPQALLVHHTGGREDTPQQLANVLRGRTDVSPQGASVQFFIARDGKTYMMTPEGQIALHAGTLEKSMRVAGRRLGNVNLEGVEVAAKNERDVTPAERAAIARLYALRAKRWGWKDPKTSIYGHGELTRRKEPQEGSTARMIREGNVPIPKLQFGGIAETPTVAFLGEDGPEAVVPLGSRAFISGIGTGETHWSPAEARDMRLNLPRTNPNVAARGGHEADFGFMQMNPANAAEYVKKGMDPLLAQQLYGGWMGGTTPEKQIQAVDQYLKMRWPKQYEKYLAGEHPSFEGFLNTPGVRGMWSALKPHPYGRPEEAHAEFDRVIRETHARRSAEHKFMRQDAERPIHVSLPPDTPSLAQRNQMTKWHERAVANNHHGVIRNDHLGDVGIN